MGREAESSGGGTIEGGNVDTSLTRRNFVKWSALSAGAASLVGLTSCSSGGGQGAGQEASGEKGTWLTGACMNNCSCGSSRCLLRVYVEDSHR